MDLFGTRPGVPTAREQLEELMREATRIAEEAANEADKIQLPEALAFARDARKFANRWKV
jgi:hypothetical protein